MRCPACGHEEKMGDVCSRCATPLPTTEEKTAPSPAVPQKPPAARPPVAPKEGKHRSRPLHDLDLTLPELEIRERENLKPEVKKVRPEEAQPGTSTESSSFKITDRRPRFDDSNAPAGAKPAPATAPDRASERRSDSLPPSDFTSFIYSLGASALVALGETLLSVGKSSPDAPPPVNLVQAKELIDLLGLLEEKTKGNLTPDESEMLTQTLYALRMKYIQVAKIK